MATAELRGKAYLDTRAWASGIRSLQRSVRRFGRDIGRPLSDAAGRLSRIGAVGMTIAVGGIATATRKIANLGDTFDKMSGRTGIATDVLSRFAHAAELSGASIDNLERALARMSTAIYDARRGTATYVDAFSAIGVAVEELEGMSPTAAFERISLAIAAVEDPLMQSAAALRIFGRQGRQLLPMLAQGADGLQAMMDEADRLGIVFTPEQAKAAAVFNDEITRLKGSFTGLLREAVALPEAANAVRGLTRALVQMRESAQFRAFVDRIGDVGQAFINLPRRAIGAWQSLDETTRTGLQSVLATSAAFIAAFRLGLVGPFAQLIAGMVTSLLTGINVMNGALLAFATGLAGYQFGKTIEKQFGVGTALMVGFQRMGAGMKRAVGLMSEEAFQEFWARGNELMAASTQDAAETFKQGFLETVKADLEGLGGLLPESVRQFIDAWKQIELPEMPNLGAASPFRKTADDLAEAENSLLEINRLTAPIRGFATGFQRAVGSFASAATSPRSDAGMNGANRDMLAEQRKANMYLQQMSQRGYALNFGW